MLSRHAAALVLLAAGLMATGQPVAAAQTPALPTELLDGGSVRLDGPWLFHLGDDPAWASPSVDAATGHNGWQAIAAGRTLGAEAIPHYTGYVWYRRTIDIAPASGPPANLALLLGHVDGAYQLYWNGALVGASGNLPPHPRWYADALPRIYNLGAARQGVLALRVWTTSELFYSFHHVEPFTAPPVVGSPGSIAALKAAADYRWFLSQQYGFTLSLLYALVLAISLIGWLWNRHQHALLWMAAFCFCSLLIQLMSEVWVPWPGFFALSSFVLPADDAVLWYLLYNLLGLKANRRLGKVTFVLGVYFLCAALVQPLLGLLDWTGPAFHFWYWPRTANLHLGVMIAAVYPFVLVGFGLTRRLDWARLLLAITAVLAKLMSILPSGFAVRWPRATLFSVHGNPFSPVTLTSTALLISVVYAVYRQQRESNRRQSVLEQEFHNARAVQQVLIPEETPAVPGFRVESVYKPAGEVGGDFFQIVALPDGALLAVIGDVSGKGMPAAMTVSLLVGTVRTLAHYTQSPGEMLAAMNQRMLRRSQGGFTTCLVLRADPGGQLTVANAGHIAPYLRGKELPVENGLPLGLDAAAVYAERTFALAADEQLTLVTDGVVEARSAAGGLFGFERTAAIAGDSAESIAQAAQDFGQNDDITVLTLTRLTVAEPQSAPIGVPAEAPA